MIKTKQAMVPILFTAEGTPRNLSVIDCQRLSELIKEFEHSITSSKHAHSQGVMQELFTSANSYPIFSDKKLEHLLCNNRTLQNLEHMIAACKQGNFDQAVTLLKPFSAREIIAENTHANNQFMRSHYKETFNEHYTEVGIAKQFSADPYFHTVNNALMSRKYGTQNQDGSWHTKPLTERIREQVKQPFTTPHAANKELAWRKQMHDALMQQVSVTERIPALDNFLYNYISCINPHDARMCNQYLAYACSIDHHNQSTRELYSILHNQSGIPHILYIPESIAQQIPALPTTIGLSQYAFERECLYNLITLKTSGLCSEAMFNQAMSYIHYACTSPNSQIAQTYRIMAQSVVHACYQNNTQLLEQCNNFLNINHEGRAALLHQQTIPQVAVLLQHIYDPRIKLPEQQKQYLARVLTLLHQHYTDGICNHKIYAQNSLSAYLAEIEKYNLHCVGNAGICIANTIPLQSDIDYKLSNDCHNIHCLIEHYVEPFIKFESTLLSEKIFGKEYLEPFQALCADTTIGAKIYTAWQEADQKSQTLVPQHLENVAAHEMIDYLNGLQARFARDQESYLLKAARLNHAVSDRVNYIVRCFEKANVIGALELIKQGIAVEQVIAHPLVAAQKLVDGTGSLIKFTGKCLVAYGYEGLMPENLLKHRDHYRQEVDSVMKALWHLPLYEKYKIAVKLMSNTYLTSTFINVLSKVKPFLQIASDRLYVALRKNIFNKIQDELAKRLFRVAEGEIKAIESLETVRDTHLIGKTTHTGPPALQTLQESSAQTIEAVQESTLEKAITEAPKIAPPVKAAEQLYYFSQEVINEAVKFAQKENKIDHVFKKEMHKLGPLVQQLGNRENVLRAIFKELSGKVKFNEIFKDIPIIVEGYTVYVRGRVMDGVVKIGTFFIK